MSDETFAAVLVLAFVVAFVVHLVWLVREELK